MSKRRPTIQAIEAAKAANTTLERERVKANIEDAAAMLAFALNFGRRSAARRLCLFINEQARNL